MLSTRPRTYIEALGDLPELSPDIPSTLVAGFFLITPPVAKLILAERNGANRTIKPMKLGQLIHDILSGQFRLNGESIVFGYDGQLIDGQHRLTGCVKTSKPILSLVAFGIEPDARSTVDQGASRNTGDFLIIEGDPNGNTVAAIAKLIFTWKRNSGANISNSNKVARSQILETVEEHPEIVDAGKFSSQVRSPGLAPPSALGFCYWLIARKYGAEIAAIYLEQIAHGDGLRLGDGALVARNRLIAEGRSSRETKIEIILRGFVHHYSGRSVNRINLTGNLPELPSHTRKAA